jgi:magnesium-transporting ATPase (P-type)
MSVIVRGPDKRIKLYTKGADTVIYERLAPNQTFSDPTLVHLEVSLILLAGRRCKLTCRTTLRKVFELYV